MDKTRQIRGPERRPVHWRSGPAPQRSRSLLRSLSYILGGGFLVAAFAFAGHEMGDNAIARSLPESLARDDIAAPASTLGAKGSLLGNDAALIVLPPLNEQEVMATAKQDAVEPERDAVEPEPATAALAPEAEKPLARRLGLTPPVWKLESTFKLKRHEKQRVVAQRRVRLAEENCLARAIYFEAGAETELGQLAVAKVILNRVKDPQFPNSICGVVYQGASQANRCQFSFACDGSPDEPRSRRTWDRAKRVAQMALAGDRTVQVMGAATYYHADYVHPKWSRNMKRLIKIGRHIFYADS